MKKILKLFCIISLFITNVVYADIKFWTTEVQPARMAKQEEMAKAFEAKTGIKVDVIPIEEKELGTRATAAAAAGDLPDVIYHTLQYVLPWAEAGILDVDANNAVVKELGKNTFAPGALNMAKSGSKIAAVPVDGWTQMVVYRKDLFDNAELEPPTSYANIVKAVEKLSKTNGMFGFVAATKTDENFMSQVLEHVLLANGVNFVKKGGYAVFFEVKGKNSKNSDRVLKEISCKGLPTQAEILGKWPTLGGWAAKSHIVTDHPIFKGLPSNQIMHGVYENIHPVSSMAKQEGVYIAGLIGYDHFPNNDIMVRHYNGPGEVWWAADVLETRMGRGKILLSTLQIINYLGKDPVADKLLFNIINYITNNP